MTPRHVRALRGTASAWIATIIAATSHTLAGGGGPSPALVAVIGVLAAPLAVLLIGRRLTAWRVGATVVVAQAMFHVAFEERDRLLGRRPSVDRPDDADRSDVPRRPRDRDDDRER